MSVVESNTNTELKMKAFLSYFLSLMHFGQPTIRYPDTSLKRKIIWSCKFEPLLYECASLPLIRESVDSLCRDGADAQYMQYLSKSRITSPQTRKSLFKRPGFLFECLCDQQDSYKWPKATWKTDKHKSVR